MRNVITTHEQLAEMVAFYSSVGAFSWDTETWMHGTGKSEDRKDPLLNSILWISFATDNPHGEVRSDVIPLGHPNGEFTHWDKPLLAEGVRRQMHGKPLRDPQDFSKDRAKWVPKFTEPPKQLRPAEVFTALHLLLFGDAIKVAQNAKFDIKSTAKYYRGKIPAKTHFCTFVASFVLDNRNRHKLNLQAIVKRELGIDIEKGIGACVEAHSFDDVAKYALIDAEVTWEAYKVLTAKIAATGNLQYIFDLEMDVLPAISDMELVGVEMDEKKLAELDKQLRIDIEIARGEVFRIAGRAFNLNSNPEKQKLLFTPRAEGGRGIKPNTRKKECLTPKGFEAAKANEPLEIKHFSVGADALEVYRGKDGLLDAMLHYADLNKLASTYITPYYGGEVVLTTGGKSRTEVRESLLIKGRVHTDFVQTGAETGRFSSRKPNLQNIPAPDDRDPKNYGKLIRSLYIAGEGFKEVQADYSQIEPRIIASLSGDPTLLRNYREGLDVYTTVGDTMGVPRKAGKELVLSIAYGVGADTVAKNIGCSVKEAKDLRKEFGKKFPEIDRHKNRVVRQAKSRPVPYVETVLGRRRYIPLLRSREQWQVNRGERQVYNTLIQGTGADIMKIALVRAHSCFEDEPDVNLILTVHDELVALCPTHMADEVAGAIRESMEGVRIKGIIVPLVAETKIGDNWGEFK